MADSGKAKMRLLPFDGETPIRTCPTLNIRTAPHPTGFQLGQRLRKICAVNEQMNTLPTNSK